MKAECRHFEHLTKHASYWRIDLPKDLREKAATEPVLTLLTQLNKRLSRIFCEHVSDVDRLSKSDDEQRISHIGLFLAMLQDAPVRALGSSAPRSPVRKVYKLIADRDAFSRYVVARGLLSKADMHEHVCEVMYQSVKVLFRRWLAFVVRVSVDIMATDLVLGDFLPLPMTDRERLHVRRDRWVRQKGGERFLDRDRARETPHGFEVQILRHPRAFHEALIPTISGLRALRNLLKEYCDSSMRVRHRVLPIYTRAMAMVVYTSLWSVHGKEPTYLAADGALEGFSTTSTAHWVHEYGSMPFVSAYLHHLAYRHTCPGWWLGYSLDAIRKDVPCGWIEYVDAVRLVDHDLDAGGAVSSSRELSVPSPEASSDASGCQVQKTDLTRPLVHGSCEGTRMRVACLEWLK